MSSRKGRGHVIPMVTADFVVFFCSVNTYLILNHYQVKECFEVNKAFRPRVMDLGLNEYEQVCRKTGQGQRDRDSVARLDRISGPVNPGSSTLVNLQPGLPDWAGKSGPNLQRWIER